MEANSNTEIRSEAVQAILSAVPRWMIRWGNTLLLALVLLLLCICWFVKYPDVVIAEARLVTKYPTQKESAKMGGKIGKILVEDGQKVKSNQALAIIESPTNSGDALLLKSIIDTIKLGKANFEFPLDNLPILFLGQMHENYSRFENSYRRYLGNKKGEAITPVLQDFNRLKNALKEWESTYLLKSEIEGKIAFFEPWKVGQNVKKDELLFLIIPEQEGGYMAKLKLQSLNSGKVKIGQAVQLKIENYPHTEYGVLQGEIINISPFANNEGDYTIEVALPEKLITNYGKEVTFKYEMRGVAEIILEDLRLIERFF